ncbi:hypothetical protein [Candidatus Laterigemmans baculatus]|uniref:hypothetical protein n=1 Tax=Candidatus Laterigemmans baculatus TaxID=2770505 RepID=UPI0013DCCE56|nr:hypothetical protein [Candidatus Laterigemmans baculatus]
MRPEAVLEIVILLVLVHVLSEAVLVLSEAVLVLSEAVLVLSAAVLDLRPVGKSAASSTEY